MKKTVKELSKRAAAEADKIVKMSVHDRLALLRVARAVDAFADDRWNFDIVSDSATPATWLAVIDALKEVEHLLGVDK